MSISKRVYLAILRRPLQSFVICLMIFFMSTMFMVGGYIRNMIDCFYDQFTIVQGYNIQVQKLSKDIGGESKIDENKFQQIKQNNCVVGINSSNDIECEPINIQNVPYLSERGIAVAKQTELVTLVANYETTFYKTFRNEYMEVIEGQYPEVTGGGVLIDSELAEINKLNIGSHIQLYSEYLNETVDVEVVGIYHTKQAPRKEVSTEAGESYFIESSSYIFCTYELLEQFGYIEDQRNIINVYVGKKEDMKEVEQYLKTTVFLGDDYNIVNTMENEITGNGMVINALKKSADSIIFLTGITSSFIIFMLTLLWMRKHIYETGIYIALGTPKTKIVCIFLMEIFMICLPACLLAVISGSILFSQNSQRLFQFIVGENILYLGDEQLKQYIIQNSFSVFSLIKSGVFSIFIAMLATLLSCGRIIKYNPRDLLQEK